MSTCLKCKKTLTDPESVRLGIGPVCRAKQGNMETTAYLRGTRFETRRMRALYKLLRLDEAAERVWDALRTCAGGVPDEVLEATFRSILVVDHYAFLDGTYYLVDASEILSFHCARDGLVYEMVIEGTELIAAIREVMEIPVPTEDGSDYESEEEAGEESEEAAGEGDGVRSYE